MIASESSKPVTESTPALVMDLKGLVCPIPVVKVANAIKTIELGEVIEATGTDPGILADIPAWCKGTGHELLDIGRDGKTLVFRVRRTK